MRIGVHRWLIRPRPMFPHRHIRHKRTILAVAAFLSSARIRSDNPMIFSQPGQLFTGLAQLLLIHCRGNPFLGASHHRHARSPASAHAAARHARCRQGLLRRIVRSAMRFVHRTPPTHPPHASYRTSPARSPHTAFRAAACDPSNSRAKSG